MKGSFNEKSLLAYSELVAEKIDVDFAEGEVYDFTRCVRANGSFYGTSGRCRQGSPAGPKEEEAPKRSQVDLVTPQPQGQADIDRVRKFIDEERTKLKNINESMEKNPQFAKDPEVRKRKEFIEGNLKAGLKALVLVFDRVEKQKEFDKQEKAKESEAAPKATVAAKTAPTIGELATTRKQLSDKSQDARAAANKAQNEHKFLTQRLRGDNSPGAKAQLLKSGKALDKAQQARDRAQRAWQKVDDKIDREQEKTAKKSEAPLRGQNLANKMMDHVNISNRVAANHGGAIRTKAAKEEHAAELKKAGVPDRATLTAALKAQRDEGKKSQ